MPHYIETFAGLIYIFEPKHRAKTIKTLSASVMMVEGDADYPIALRLVPRRIVRNARASLAKQESAR